MSLMLQEEQRERRIEVAGNRNVNDALKLPDEYRERRIEHDPAESEADTNYITVDPDTRLMLKDLG